MVWEVWLTTRLFFADHVVGCLRYFDEYFVRRGAANALRCCASLGEQSKTAGRMPLSMKDATCARHQSSKAWLKYQIPLITWISLLTPWTWHNWWTYNSLACFDPEICILVYRLS